MRRLQIQPIPCLRDNYAYLVRADGDAWLVDPSELGPPKEALGDLQLRGILATHHHYDHVGGIEGLVAGAPAPIVVAAHASDRGRVPAQNHFIDAPAGRFVPAGFEILGRPAQAMWIPGHTLGAIAWYLPPEVEGEGGDVFTGDTLFAAGCGRLFEGTPEQMHTSLQALTALPGSTRLWFGHEYTAANLRFAAQVEPDNPAIRQRQADLPSCTTPTTVALERATNPFVRAATAEVLAERRAAKDTFRG
ncbi:MAG: hydroxyacylglutathione hydrolase [Nannocystaceae bacterium]